MSFDQGSTLPIVDLHKKTTKVNAGIITAVILFFLATAGVVWYIAYNSEDTTNEMHEKAEQQAVPAKAP